MIGLVEDEGGTGEDMKQSAYERILVGLQQAGVEYAVVGGVAMNLHGVPRMTADVDIVVPPDEANLRRLWDTARSLGLRPRQPIALKTFCSIQALRTLAQEKNLRAVTFEDPRQVFIQLDVIVFPSVPYSEIAERRVWIAVGSARIPVVGIDDLIRMKKASGRLQDRADVDTLMRLKEREK